MINPLQGDTIAALVEELTQEIRFLIKDRADLRDAQIQVTIDLAA